MLDCRKAYTKKKIIISNEKKNMCGYKNASDVNYLSIIEIAKAIGEYIYKCKKK